MVASFSATAGSSYDRLEEDSPGSEEDGRSETTGWFQHPAIVRISILANKKAFI